MDRSLELVAGQRHAELLAESARRRLSEGKAQATRETATVGHRPPRRLVLWSPLAAR
jgi:hypothetical protein